MMKKLILLCCIAIVALTGKVNAQNKEMKGKHEINIFVSDATTLNMSDFFADGLTNAIIPGTFKTEGEGTIMPGIGYRYFLNNRLSIGADLGYQHHKLSEVIDKTKSKGKGYTENSNRFLILPTASFTYLQKGLFRLYGNAGVGTMISYNQTKDSSKKEKTTTKTDFAFQVNPIGIRIGNEHIGGFAEIGIGYKGFVGVGVSVQL